MTHFFLPKILSLRVCLLQIWCKFSLSDTCLGGKVCHFGKNASNFPLVTHFPLATQFFSAKKCVTKGMSTVHFFFGIFLNVSWSSRMKSDNYQFICAQVSEKIVINFFNRKESMRILSSWSLFPWKSRFGGFHVQYRLFPEII